MPFPAAANLSPISFRPDSRSVHRVREPNPPAFVLSETPERAFLLWHS